MGDLSKDFSRAEFKCRCGCGEVEIHPDLLDSLQQLRDLAGGPIRINSGYRCEKHNREVGGKPESYHRYGMAADIVIEGRSMDEMYQLAVRIPRFKDGGIGRYPSQKFIHVDVRSYPARWEG